MPFDEQLRIGLIGEACLDEFFADKGYAVEKATRREQKLGIDRWLHRLGLPRVSMEYKTDLRAAATGNAYIETVSIDTRRKEGWAYASHADWLTYFVPGLRHVYMLQPATLRSYLPDWLKEYPVVQARPDEHGSRRHSGEGLLVPLPVLRRACEALAIYSGHLPAILTDWESKQYG